MREIQLKFRDIAEGRPHRLFLLPPEAAIAYIDECAAGGFFLLGVEGFIKPPGGAYQPSMEHSNDIDDTDLSQTAFVEETKRFIMERSSIPWIHFEIVYEQMGGQWIGVPPWAANDDLDKK